MADAPARFCLLTPLGEGGIGVIALWGPGAPSILATVFRGTKRQARDLKVGALAHGAVLRGEQVIDEVVLARPDPPYPGTEAPYFEINCHGGVIAVRAMLERLAAEGAEAGDVAGDGAPLHPLSAEGIRQEALAKLPRVPTRLGALVLLHQAAGALAAACSAVRDALEAGMAGRAAELTDALLGSAPLGLDLLSPPRVALLGPPNAGKSTLVNALLQEERVIIHHEPGTTRDVVVERVSIRGMPFDLMDSAGLREAADEVEVEAVRRAARLAGDCDVALFVFDASAGPAPETGALPSTRAETRVLFVANKIDLLTGESPRTAPAGHPVVAVSALTARGIPKLEEALLQPYADLMGPARQGRPVIFTIAQKAVLQAVAACLADRDCGGAARLLSAGPLVGGSEPETGHDKVEQPPRAEGDEEHDG